MHTDGIIYLFQIILFSLILLFPTNHLHFLSIKKIVNDPPFIKTFYEIFPLRKTIRNLTIAE